ncbi:Gfo/Idh/MocA family oxidoreductase [Fusobacterium ulcerans]|uniref:Gfo/Idh/MocA family protein n=1 Tax=Fusobacterium ulcerans TaxID=861 RepID=UPI0010329B62|nr:Gfo/Idh/MocA family oxidoreductase [Fusobacterium ulcerans]
MVRFGIIGTSSISDKFVEALKTIKKCEVTAVYSRSVEKGDYFATKHDIKTIYLSLEEMAESQKVDAVYIASPNGLHPSQAIKMMKSGKHVICEKAIAPTVKELDEMIKTAKENNVVLMEAMRPTLNPNFNIIKESLEKIGPVRGISASYCQYSSRYDNLKKGELTNIFDPKFSGGALYDIGVYPLYFTIGMFGIPEEYMGKNYLVSSGADGYGSIILKYSDKIASITYSKITDSKTPSEIQGEKGSIIIGKLSTVNDIKIVYRDGREEKIEIDIHKNDMVYEAMEFINLIKKGKLESDVNSHKNSRKVVEIMENLANKN